MKIIGVEQLNVKFNKAGNQHVCPECGDNMAEVDRVNESKAVFIWYECGRNGCTEQWLQKIVRHCNKTPDYGMVFSDNLATAS